MKYHLLVIVTLACFSLTALGQTAPANNNKDATALRREIAAAVTAMARVGRASGASFSPDGKWISFVADLSGVPQVWVVPVEGGYPRMVTNGDDPVLSAAWSPASDWIAVTIAPGGGLNSQVYVVKPDGSGLRRLTDGGKDNNAFNAWTDDGKKIAIDSSRLDPASRDCFIIDVASGDIKLVSRNPGLGNIEGISKDSRASRKTESWHCCKGCAIAATTTSTCWISPPEKTRCSRGTTERLFIPAKSPRTGVRLTSPAIRTAISRPLRGFLSMPANTSSRSWHRVKTADSRESR